MKTKFDPRHLKRIADMKSLFAHNFGRPTPKTDRSPSIIKNLPEIDQLITLNAPKWPLNKINQVDLAILRCAVWELKFQKANPAKVIIDEAIELGKEFGTEASPSFINGVLGSIINHDQPSTSTTSNSN